jgi:hypothetical protein
LISEVTGSAMYPSMDIEHPEITCTNRTGYPSWKQEDDDELYCCECGRVIKDDEDSYECDSHAVLCEDCLKMLHKR